METERFKFIVHLIDWLQLLQQAIQINWKQMLKKHLNRKTLTKTKKKCLDEIPCVWMLLNDVNGNAKLFSWSFLFRFQICFFLNIIFQLEFHPTRMKQLTAIDLDTISVRRITDVAFASFLWFGVRLSCVKLRIGLKPTASTKVHWIQLAQRLGFLGRGTLCLASSASH